MNSKKFIFTVFLALGFATAAFSQIQHFTSASLGMGGGGTAYVDGYHANFVNPANLMLDRFNRPRRQVGILGGVGVRAGGTLVNVPVWNEYFTKGLTFDGQDRIDALNGLFGDETQSGTMKDVATTVDVIPFGFSNRGTQSSFSVAVRARTMTNQEISRGLAELYLFGLDPEQFADPRQVNIRSEAVSFSEISVGYARKLLSLPNLFFAKNINVYAGVAPKAVFAIGTNSFSMNSTVQMLQGANQETVRFVHDFDYQIETYGDLAEELTAFENELQVNPDAEFDDFVGDGSYASPQFSGFAFDLGGTVEMDITNLPIPFFAGPKKLTVGLSLTDLGNVTYDDENRIFRRDGVFDFSGAGPNEDIDDFYDNLGDSLKNEVYLNFTSEETGEIENDLPSKLNFGAHLSMGKLSTSLDYSVGFNNQSTNSKLSTVVLGAEYRFFNFVPLRVGTRFGGFSSTVYTAGFGLDFRFLEFTVAGAFPSKGETNGSSIAAAWSGLVIRF